MGPKTASYWIGTGIYSRWKIGRSVRMINDHLVPRLGVNKLYLHSHYTPSRLVQLYLPLTQFSWRDTRGLHGAMLVSLLALGSVVQYMQMDVLFIALCSCIIKLYGSLITAHELHLMARKLITGGVLWHLHCTLGCYIFISCSSCL